MDLSCFITSLKLSPPFSCRIVERFEKSESEEKDRTLGVFFEPSIAHLTQKVLKLLAVSAPLTLLGTDPAFAVSQIPQSFVTSLGDFGDISSGFASAFLLIFFSEPGDTTFFSAALLAARNNTAALFPGTFGTLGYAFFLKQRRCLMSEFCMIMTITRRWMYP
ncbi:hypothetical protein Bca52824_026583 [Brassica carinata]|uniref:GDT1 family protein n=1 Tax=Brassica carinata TaxID=52824 RepID=A0A8X7SJX7_BRACI|nr:hypothetical protein Bca52824_026583 [Brassica carinata]